MVYFGIFKHLHACSGRGGAAENLFDSDDIVTTKGIYPMAVFEEKYLQHLPAATSGRLGFRA